MFICDILLVVSLMAFLRGFHVSCCDYNCTDKPVFTPSSLVVKFGDPTSATCSVCQPACTANKFDVETPLGKKNTSGNRITWKVESVTEWDASPECYHTTDRNTQCCTILPVIVYQPPDHVSISFINGHTGPMIEDQQYTLQCLVHEVAPVENLTVTLYKGQTVLGQQQSNKTGIKPVTETFTFDITPSKEDDGVQYWCEAKLELGPEGPQHPPLVTSPKIPTTVHYLSVSSQPDPITILEGSPLQLNCSADGNPRPSYTWTLPVTSSLPVNSRILTITSVAVEDQGEYKCFVSNNVRNSTLTYHVNVEVDNIVIIIVAVVAAVVLVVLLGAYAYSRYYKHNRTGRYNLFRFRPKGSTVV